MVTPVQSVFPHPRPDYNRVAVVEHVVGFIHQLADAPAKLPDVAGLEIFEGAVLSTSARLAATETNLGVGMNGDHAEGFAPSSREHLAFSHAAKAVDHQQSRPVLHAVNGVSKADGEHVVAVLCPQFNGDSSKDTWVALESLAQDLLSHHVAHGANRERERRGHVCEFPLAASGQATDGQHTDHARPCRRGDMKGATDSVLEGLLSPPHVDERPQHR